VTDALLEQSAVPTWPVFVRPVLEVLVDIGTLKRQDIIDRVAVAMDLSDEAKAEVVPNGEARYRGRISWAITHANRADLLERPVRATYRLTPKGRDWLQQFPAGLSSFTEANEYFAPYWHKPETDTTAGLAVDAGTTEPAGVVTSPEEQIADAVSLLNDDVRSNLLARIQEASPQFFEDAVVNLLLAMGYGGAEKRGQVVGKSHDGGIDGVIDEDPLGLDRVYIQAKRYAEGNTVGREAIQAFVGALHGHAASKGVFITTSAFTKPAQDYAHVVPSRVILIDGKRLTALLVKYRVGVQVKDVYEVMEIDEDFFD
jgi:restriction system protein